MIDFLTTKIFYLGTIVAFFAVLAKYRKALLTLLSISEKIENFDKKIEKICYELEYNGNGSTKDATRRIENTTKEIQKVLEMMTSRDDIKFRKEKYPCFECDSEGKNIRVSNAYLQLLKLRVGSDLDGFDWRKFMHLDDRKPYFDHFKEQSDSKSDFAHPARFYDNFRTFIGKWDIQAAYIKGDIYFAIFVPLDDTAKQIFTENNWVLL